MGDFRDELRRQMEERAAAEKDDDPKRPYVRAFSVERSPDRPPRLMAEVPCGDCGEVHAVPFSAMGKTVIKTGQKPPGAPCDPSKPWFLAISARIDTLKSYAEAKADLKAARSEWRRAKRGNGKPGPDVG